MLRLLKPNHCMKEHEPDDRTAVRHGPTRLTIFIAGSPSRLFRTSHSFALSERNLYSFVHDRLRARSLYPTHRVQCHFPFAFYLQPIVKAIRRINRRVN
jgi:hypothetical protein